MFDEGVAMISPEGGHRLCCSRVRAIEEYSSEISMPTKSHLFLGHDCSGTALEKRVKNNSTLRTFCYDWRTNGGFGKDREVGAGKRLRVDTPHAPLGSPFFLARD